MLSKNLDFDEDKWQWQQFIKRALRNLGLNHFPTSQIICSSMDDDSKSTFLDTVFWEQSRT